MSAIAALWVHNASVETFLGAGSTGDTYAPAAPIRGFLDDGVVRVQTPSGEELVQKSIWFGPLADAPIFVPESKVTVNGRESQVSAVRLRSGGPLGLPDHVEVDLT